MTEDGVPTGASGIEDGRRLLLAAFEQARARRKHDWSQMTAAVLKNRMLQLSRGSFDEHELGAESFVTYLERFPDVVAVDRSRKPPMVTLVSEQAVRQLESGKHASQWIRPDLWNAVMDYRQGATYIWDLEAGRARVGNLDEGPVLPTIIEATMREWRHDFRPVAESLLITDDERRALAAWQERVLPTYALPVRARVAWNRYVTDRAIERLRGWFGENGIDPPDDLVGAGRPEGTAAGALREFVQEVVRQMSERELQQLNLPAEAVHRVVGRYRRT